MTPSVGLVVPAYKPDPDELVAYLDRLTEKVSPDTIRVELDAADEHVRCKLEETDAIVRCAEERRGKGAALTDGFNRLDTNIRAFADSDGSVPAESVREVIAGVAAGNADLVAGSRRHPAAEVVSHESWLRKMMGDVFAWTARRFISPPLYDYQCGAKALTEDLWERINPDIRATGYGWDIEVVGVADTMGATILEQPVVWEDHPTSTVSPFPTAVALTRSLLRTAWYQRHHG